MKKLILIFLILSNYIYSQSVVKTYYDPLYKTKLKEVYQVKPNTPILNGNYKSYDEYGFLLVDRNYINNIQNGKSTSYFGANEASLQYDNARKVSLGKISGTFNYKNGDLDGLQTYFDYSKDGVRFTLKKETYVNGIMIAFTENYSNGVVKKNIQNGKCYENYESGKKLAEYTADKNGQLQGKYTAWYESGVIKKTGEFVDDNKNGSWFEYNEDSTVKLKEDFELGKRVQTAEEKIIEEQKKKENEEKILEQKRLKIEKDKEYAKEQELKKLKTIQVEKESQLYRINEDFRMESQLITTKYQYWDQDRYKFLKINLYNSYIKVSNYVSEYLNNNENDIDKKIELAKNRLKIATKMNNIVDSNTRDLEKELKKTEDIQQIINIFNQEK